MSDNRNSPITSSPRHLVPPSPCPLSKPLITIATTQSFETNTIPEKTSHMEAGIVGLPNVGKSTLFNALTSAGIASENYPFCTIEPNTGIVPVPDPRLNTIQSFIKTQKVVPAILKLVDIGEI